MRTLASILALLFVIATAIKTWTFLSNPEARHLYTALIFLVFALFFLIASTIPAQKPPQKF